MKRAEALGCERRNGQAGRYREVFIELGQLSAQRNLSLVIGAPISGHQRANQWSSESQSVVIREPIRSHQ